MRDPAPSATPGTAWLHDLGAEDATARRRAVAKAITLVESSRPEHRADAEAMLAALPSPATSTLRLGISGSPGVGKSTFVEALGLRLVQEGHRVAVLAVDPSSNLSGGSILGDKTRMERLSMHPAAFVRPSPSRGTLGGVATATRDAIAIVESAGYDVVLVETVGVGQSEAAVAGMTDALVLLQLPNAGDDLQAIKKGVLEVADLVVVNKADLDAAAASRAAGQIESALRTGSGGGDGAEPRSTKVLQTSALSEPRVAEVWAEIEAWAAARRASGALAGRRRAQVRSAVHERVDAELRLAFRDEPRVRAALAATLADAEAGRLAVSTAARRLVDAFLGRGPDA